jgi:adenosylhomocysteine nucleosidase
LEKAGLIAAMPQESQALLRRLSGWERTRVGPLRGYHFQIGIYDCLMVQSGIGVKRAVQAANWLLQASNLQWLASFGIAGAASEDLQIGDVVIAGNTCTLERGFIGPLMPLATLSETARMAVAQAMHARAARLVSGTTVTTRGSQWIHPGQVELLNPVLEMETWGIAGVAAERSVPLLSLRAVSDGPLAPIPLDLEQVYDDEYHLRFGQLLKITLQQPGLLLKTRTVMQNIQIAADQAAIALLALLAQPLPIFSLEGTQSKAQ